MKSIRLFSLENNSKIKKMDSKRNFGNFNMLNSDAFSPSEKYINAKKAMLLKEKGNDFANKENYQEAIRLYERGILLKPDYDDLYLNLGKIYKKLDDKQKEFQSYQRLLNVEPNHLEALTLAGETAKEKGDLTIAQGFFQKAVNIDKNYDYALRNLKEVEYLKVLEKDPTKAKAIFEKQSHKNIREAISFLEKHFKKSFIKEIENVEFVFGKTSSIDGVENIAQYENSIKRIVVTDKYMWASPQVVAAYLVHEAVHAKDKDAFTSIKEEQDAYRESVKFWQKFNNGIKDPELDYAKELYLKSPKILDEKVKEVYSSHDDMPMNSPYHGINMRGLNKFFFNVKAKFLNNETSLKNQAIIAGFDLKQSSFL